MGTGEESEDPYDLASQSSPRLAWGRRLWSAGDSEPRTHSNVDQQGIMMRGYFFEIRDGTTPYGSQQIDTFLVGRITCA